MSTLVREYRLPHCTVILEGFTTQAGGALAVLIQMDCYLPGLEHPMRGGSELLEHLSRTVSEYVQNFLSHREPMPVHPAGPVALEPLSQHQHRLRVHPELLQEAREPVQLDLTTIQLFDLLEAFDQGMSDPQTLPDWTFDLVPRMPRSLKLSQQTVPAGVGLTTLAAAAVALALLPSPKIEPPPELRETPTATTAETQPTPAASPSPSPTPSPTITPTPTPSPTVALAPTDTSRLLIQVYEEINAVWNERITQDLSFRVGVNAQGKVVNFTPLGTATGEANLLPLEKLKQPGQAVAEFRVVFKESGALEVSPY
ncbi:hypothetical protein GlitD10_0950 [Gloeomargarita lithophora Alchichica-D10]|uniref:DUF4335 domain-containing protein n=1 Tax=Gloeomargarita lithophora Alchichica-D10 TaxID=1188229 RepID=A0A1J0ABF7_9CYAN|nr:DUF4335 domain-containing protein [Gloeomargarita lithophora]APB33268.1 hypothetical protein GlitD10_0950 [Gloeomargarita lithophora Alchichica-D10]